MVSNLVILGELTTDFAKPMNEVPSITSTEKSRDGATYRDTGVCGAQINPDSLNHFVKYVGLNAMLCDGSGVASTGDEQTCDEQNIYMIEADRIFSLAGAMEDARRLT